MTANATETDIHRACMHEAGHVAMALALGWEVQYAVVNSDGTGHTQTNHLDFKRPCPLEYAMVKLAGSCAEQLWCGQEWDEWSELDRREAERIGFGERAMATLAGLAQGELQQLEANVKRVAQALRLGCDSEVSGQSLAAAYVGTPS